ncbi:MAG: zinc ribbon domain-containing protein [Lachnospiraceae bacterium]
MMPTTMLIIAGVLALVATVLAFIYVVPEKKREKLGAFGKFLHDTCNFKYLMVEKILQALYIFTTAAVIIFGVLMLFRTEYNYWTGDRIWMGGYGLLIIILGPIAIRLSYELMMMAILLLKNVISINHKLADQTGKGSDDVFAAPNMQEMKEALRQRREATQAAQAAQSQPANFCSQCGAKLENGVCPHCSAPKDSAPADSTPPQE